MTGKDTAENKMLWYMLEEDTVSMTTPKAGQIKAIFLMTGKWHFTGPDTAESYHTLRIYLPDAQGSMLPAPDAVPFMSIDYGPVSHSRLN